MGAFLPFAWVLIPLAGIALGAFSEWLKFKKETAQLTSSTHDLQSEVVALNKALEEAKAGRQELIERIQNLEAIVTSEAWDLLGEDRDLAAAKAPSPLLDTLPDEPVHQEDDAARAARMARRLRL